MSDTTTKVDDTEALDWLRAQPDGTVLPSGAELARRWNWAPYKVSRRLRAWSEDGYILKRGKQLVAASVQHVQHADDATDKSGPEHTAVIPAEPVIARIVAGTGGRRTRSLTMGDAMAYAVAVGLAGVTASFSVRGMIVLFPGLPASIVALAVACEASKLIGVGWLARNWRDTAWTFRIVLVALVTAMAGINAVGVYSQLVAAHVGKVALTAGAHNMQAASLDAQLETAGAKVAELDKQIAAIDAVIAGAAARGKANTALAAMEGQRKVRAALVTERQRAADAVAGLKIERAGAGERAKIDAVEAAPIAYIAQLFGADGDPEDAIRWLILVMTLAADPMALALTAAVSARRVH
jgi:hypothetical protein